MIQAASCDDMFQLQQRSLSLAHLLVAVLMASISACAHSATAPHPAVVSALDNEGRAPPAQSEPSGGHNETAVATLRFAQGVYRCIKDGYDNLSSHPVDAPAAGVKVLIRIAHEGNLLSVEMTHSSGNAAFDEAVRKAISTCTQFASPPPSIANAVAEQGIEIIVQPDLSPEKG